MSFHSLFRFSIHIVSYYHQKHILLDQIQKMKFQPDKRIAEFIFTEGIINKLFSRKELILFYLSLPLSSEEFIVS